MRIRKQLACFVPVLLILILLSGCGGSTSHYDLTRYMGKSISSFEHKSKTELVKQSSGVYLMTDVIQVMTDNKKVTAVTLLKNAGEYSVFGVKVGMPKEKADQLLTEDFGTEIAKTTDSQKNWTTCSYLKDEKELYISYDSGTELITEISYYEVSAKTQKENQGETISSGQLMLTVGDTRVYYNEAMVYLKSAQEKYETDYGKNIWKADILGNGENFGNMIKQEVINQITELKVIREEAGKQGVTLSEEEIAQAASYAKEHYAGLKQEDIDKYLITEELLQQVYADNLLANKMFENLTINVDTEVPDEDAKQITVQDILVYSTDYDVEGNKIDLSEEEKAAANEKIQKLAEDAKTTQDFYALAEANSEADTIEYTFGKGQAPEELGQAFEDAAFGLKTGQISDIITTDYGWHIIYCVSDFNEDATIQVKESIIDERRNEMFSKLYADWVKEYDVVVNHEAWDSISYED